MNVLFQVFQEILHTEREYVKDIDILINSFLLPLRAVKDKISITDQDLKSLFSNIEALRPIHSQFYDELSRQFESSEKDGTEPTIGNLFISLASNLQVYTPYCTFFPKAIAHHNVLMKDNSKYSKHLKVLESDPICKNLNVGSWLIKPVQRLCKYPLLLRELISHTPESHADLLNIENAKKKVDEAVDIVNEGKRDAERQEKMKEIEGVIGGELSLVFIIFH